MAEKNGATLILFDNNRDKVFLVRRSDFPIWGLTGGGIEKGEKPIVAAEREAEEESGFKVKVVKYLGVYEILNRYGKIVRLSYLYEGRVISGEFKPEFKGCRGGWFLLDRLPADILRSTEKKIIDAKSHKGKNHFRIKRQDGNLAENYRLLFLHPIGTLKYFLHKAWNYLK